MIINCKNLPWSLDKRLIDLLQHEINSVGVNGNNGAVVNFRDPEYDAVTGGYHPVEIAVAADGRIQYVTDFALYGVPPHVELAKEIDFDFKLGLFQHMGREFPIRRGRALFDLWEKNFVSYYHSNIYCVDVSVWGGGMTPEEIAASMVLKVPDPPEPVYVVSMSDLLSVIAKRMKEQALNLCATDIMQARDEVRATFSHYLDEREYIDMGLDAWELTRGGRTTIQKKEIR